MKNSSKESKYNKKQLFDTISWWMPFTFFITKDDDPQEQTPLIRPKSHHFTSLIRRSKSTKKFPRNCWVLIVFLLSFISQNCDVFRHSHVINQWLFVEATLPTSQPSQQPSSVPTMIPSSQPSAQPSSLPSALPSMQPSRIPTSQPSSKPSMQPSTGPSSQPSRVPSSQPSMQPSAQPSDFPSPQPSMHPSTQPSSKPSRQPISLPSAQPSFIPSTQPSMHPSAQPSGKPSMQPSNKPSSQPSMQPSAKPSAQPSMQPSSQPSVLPSAQPSTQPSLQPSSKPSLQPSARPSTQPSRLPSSQPSMHPSMQPSVQPTDLPSSQPSMRPSTQPTSHPSMQPSSKPTMQPSTQPSLHPSSQPSSQPTDQPTFVPSGQPSTQPSVQPSTRPTMQPSSQPSARPSTQPSSKPSSQPSTQPSLQPSSLPSAQPSDHPSSQPTVIPSSQPSNHPSTQPTHVPSTQPSALPSAQPSTQPSKLPSSQPSMHPSTQPSSKPSMQPSNQPTMQPSMQPSSHPTSQPSTQPSAQPTLFPSAQPSMQPSEQPSSKPSMQPSSQPSTQPSVQPTSSPSAQPSTQPTSQPSTVPTVQPSMQPSHQPSSIPSVQPSTQPTSKPSCQPSQLPSSQPSTQPSTQPSFFPSSQPSVQPSLQPSSKPSIQPSSQPSCQPTVNPSSQPSTQPSTQPSSLPTMQPSSQPSRRPSCQPSDRPSAQPSTQPSNQPSSIPTTQPSQQPSTQPSGNPSRQPSAQPSAQPSSIPTMQPSMQPSMQPTSLPSIQPSRQPSSLPSMQPTSRPSMQPSGQPTVIPSMQPSRQPSSQPTLQPTNQPSSVPTQQPTMQPSTQPSVQPTDRPSTQPTLQPSVQPSTQPSMQPSMQPSSIPSTQPSGHPTMQPSTQPSNQPSQQPSSQPSSHPTEQPSNQPSAQPSTQPSSTPSIQPNAQPSSQPSLQPSSQPSSVPTTQPSAEPSSQPSGQPSNQPSMQPSSLPTCQPSRQPTIQPTSQPNAIPTMQPSLQPSHQPTTQPSIQPSAIPTSQPSSLPTMQPSVQPSSQPSSEPSNQPSVVPSAQPSSLPTMQPTIQPSAQPSSQPSSRPSMQPSVQPSIQPSRQPSAIPTDQPSAHPSTQPSCFPSSQPSTQPSTQPICIPTTQPSTQPSMQPSNQPSCIPSMQPSIQPTIQPSCQPTTRPSTQPSDQPSTQPSAQPSVQPSSQPTNQPSNQPSMQPSSQPTIQPSAQPTTQPSSQPSDQPSTQPSSQPSVQPSSQPTNQPSNQPSIQPSMQPSSQPTTQPSSQPSMQPSNQPSGVPSIQPSSQPSIQPSNQPTIQPSIQPSSQPTYQPSSQPSSQPSCQPSMQPSTQPSMQPSSQPSMQPSNQPSVQPSFQPSVQPTSEPSGQPSVQPSCQPSNQPSAIPTMQPSAQPTCQPSIQPSSQPTAQPSIRPTTQPSAVPTNQPSQQPSTQPSVIPSSQPSMQPSSRPTIQPTNQPSDQPSAQPSTQPSALPSNQPSAQPSFQPSVQPSFQPSSQPSTQPTSLPSCQPTTQPSSAPTNQPSQQPSTQPSVIPSSQPSMQPSSQPTLQPTMQPSRQPSQRPTKQPSRQPSSRPSRQPTEQPSSKPSRQPSSQPTSRPSDQPSVQPTFRPSMQPTSLPTVQPSMQPSFQPSNQPTSVPSVSYNTTIRQLRIPSNITLLLLGDIQRTSIVVGVQLHREASRVYCGAFVNLNQTFIVNAQTSSEAIVSQNMYTAGTGSTVNVLITGLTPITNYTIYCVSQSVIGTKYSSLENAYDRAITATTLCCKNIIITATSGVKAVTSGMSLIYGYTLTLDSLPTSELILSIAYGPTNGSVVSYASGFVNGTVQTVNDITMTPSIFAIASSSLLLSYTSTISASSTAYGYYRPKLTITGVSADQYNVSFASFPVLQVLASDEQPPVPYIEGAQFSSSGLYVTILFNTATNRGGYTNTFSCSALLQFAGQNRAQCAWNDDQSIAIYPVYNRNESYLPILSVGSNVTVINNGLIKASCTGYTTTFCSTWLAVGFTTVNITAPASVVAPVVKISAPFTVTSCQSFTIDLTGSGGDAGREWQSLTIVATIIDKIVDLESELNQFYKYNYSYSPPTSLPVGYLTSGTLYSFVVTLCNFLGACGTAAQVLNVVKNGSSIPTAVFVDSSSITTYRRLPLTVQANAYARDCEGEISYLNMRYNWSMTLLSSSSTLAATTTALTSTSQNPSIFRLDVYSLLAPASYQLTLIAYQYSSSVTNPTVATIAATITVIQGDLYAVIAGGSKAVIRYGRSTQFDAAASYDQDIQGLTGTAAGLSFVWSCIQTAPSFNGSCSNSLTFNGQLTNEKLSVRPLTVNATSRLTVTIHDSYSRRSSSAYVDIIVTDLPLNEISTTANTPSSLVNVPTDQRLVLASSIRVVSACTASWSVDDSAISLSDIALTATSRSLSSASALQSFNLALPANTLPQRSALSFTITCGTAQSSISVTTNGAPLPGSFEITPPSGVELTTSFFMLASLWSDENLPITYEFGYVSGANGQSMTLLSRSSMTYVANQLLTAGSKDDNYHVNCTLVIYDLYNASTTVYRSVTVTLLSPTGRTSQLTSLITTTANNGGITAQKSLISLGSDILNYPNCTLAPNCSTLHRLPCTAIAQTCDACHANYTGDNGPANTACIHRNQVKSGYLGHCNVTADCSNALLVCGKNKTCEYIDKSCNNCSTHGTCSFSYISTDIALTSCKLNEPFCKATCSCNNGYYGDSCDIDHSMLHSLRSLRTSLVDTLATVIATDDVNSETVQSHASYLSSVASNNAYELPSAAALQVQSMALTTIKQAKALKLSYTKLTGVLSAVDVVESVSLLRLTNFSRSARRRRLLNDDNADDGSNSTAAQTISILGTFADVIGDSKVYGEAETSYLYNNFRLVSNTQQIQDGVNVSVTIPSTDLESLVPNFMQSSVLIDSSHTTLNANSSLQSMDYALSAVQMREKSFTVNTDQFYSDPLHVQINIAGSSSANTSAVLQSGFINSIYLTIRNNEAINTFYDFGNATLANFTTYCPVDVLFVETFECPVSRQVFTHNCTGEPGFFMSYCPVVAPSCASINVTNLFLTPMAVCNVYNHTAEMTWCKCEVLPSEYYPQRRLLLSETDSSSSRFTALAINTQVNVKYNLSASSTTSKQIFNPHGANDFVASVVYVSQDFRNTFKSTRKLNDFQASVIVFALLSTLWGCGILLFLFVNYREQSVAKEESAKRTQALAAKKQQQLTANDTLAEKMKIQIAFYIEAIIPAVYGMKETFIQRTWREITLHHRYFHLLVPDARRPYMFDRFYRTIKILTILTLTMFIQALLYNLQDPGDDGSCSVLYTEQTCIVRKRVLDSSQDYCYWGYPGTCFYNEQPASEQAVVYVLVISILITIMAKMPVDALLKIWIAPVAEKQSKVAVAAPSATTEGDVVPAGVGADKVEGGEEEVGSQELDLKQKPSATADKYAVNKLQNDDSDSARHPHRKHKNPAQKLLQLLESEDRLKIGQGRAIPEIVTITQQEATNIFKEAEDELHKADHPAAEISSSTYKRPLPEDEIDMLCQDIITLRKTLPNTVKSTKIYEQQWDIRLDYDLQDDNEERYHRAFFKPTKDTFLTTLDDVYDELDEVETVFQALNPYSAGVELMHTFMIDLLGRKTKAAKIFRQKFSEDFERLPLVNIYIKYFAIAAIFAVNGFFMFYILLRGVQKGLKWQYRYMISVVIQLLIEVFLFETLEILWLQFIVPDSVREDVKKALTVLEMISQNTRSLLVARRHAHDCHGGRFDAPSYFFLSKHLAESRPGLIESNIVLAYRNFYPGLIARTWPHYQQRLAEHPDLEEEEEEDDDDEAHDNNSHDRGARNTSKSRYIPRAFRNAQEAFEGGAIGYGLLVGAATAIVFFLNTLGGFPMLYQKLIVRLLQTGILTGATILFYFAVKHPAFFIFFVLLVLMIIGIFVCRSYYIPSRGKSKLLPTTKLAEEPVVITPQQVLEEGLPTANDENKAKEMTAEDQMLRGFQMQILNLKTKTIDDIEEFSFDDSEEEDGDKIDQPAMFLPVMKPSVTMSSSSPPPNNKTGVNNKSSPPRLLPMMPLPSINNSMKKVVPNASAATETDDAYQSKKKLQPIAKTELLHQHEQLDDDSDADAEEEKKGGDDDDDNDDDGQPRMLSDMTMESVADMNVTSYSPATAAAAVQNEEHRSQPHHITEDAAEKGEE